MADEDSQKLQAQAESAARLALDRAHRAALQADGAALRLSLEEARDTLRDAGARPDVGTLITEALTELADGALAAMEPRLEQARSALSPQDEGGAAPTAD